MTRHILTATAGGVLGVLPVLVLVALSPWRPQAPWVAVVILLLVTLATGIGVGLVVRLAGLPRAAHTARIAALGTPVFAIFLLLLLLNAAGPGAESAQQLTALLLGPAVASALAARFAQDQPDPPGTG